MTDTQPQLRPALSTLTGERIVVRAYRDEDADAVYAAVTESIEHLRPWLPWYNTHRSVDDTLAYIRLTQSESILRKAFQLGIFSLSGNYLGGFALHVEDWSIPSFMMGYWIRLGEEGKGYITEAMKLATHAAFEHLGAERVFLYCDAQNSRSAGVAERLGFTLEGRARHERRNTSGRLADTLYYSLIKDEYEAQWLEQHTLAVSAQDSKIFGNALLSPPTPNNALLGTATLHDELIDS